jgi:hypothetical protein
MPDRDYSEKDKAVERAILEAVRSLRFGSVEVTVHNTHVIHLERREKIRFDSEGNIEYNI